MPGYVLLQRQSLSPPLPEGQGIRANTRQVGFLDFLREAEDEPFPYDENSSLLVFGLEDVLLAARPPMGPGIEVAARMLHERLNHFANEFDRRSCGDVQMIFRNDLQRGEHLWVLHPTERQPIDLIFGSPHETIINGHKVYRIGFHLSAPM
jgi:hypothetical protein